MGCIGTRRLGGPTAAAAAPLHSGPPAHMTAIRRLASHTQTHYSPSNPRTRRKMRVGRCVLLGRDVGWDRRNRCDAQQCRPGTPICYDPAAEMSFAAYLRCVAIDICARRWAFRLPCPARQRAPDGKWGMHTVLYSIRSPMGCLACSACSLACSACCSACSALASLGSSCNVWSALRHVRTSSRCCNMQELASADKACAQLGSVVAKIAEVGQRAHAVAIETDCPASCAHRQVSRLGTVLGHHHIPLAEPLVGPVVGPHTDCLSDLQRMRGTQRGACSMAGARHCAARCTGTLAWRSAKHSAQAGMVEREHVAAVAVRPQVRLCSEAGVACH